MFNLGKTKLGVVIFPVALTLSTLVLSCIFEFRNEAQAYYNSLSRCNFDITYYDIQGESLNDLKLAMLESGPIDSYGVKRFALVSWKIAWNWKLASDGSPDLNTAEITPKIILTLPRWSNQDLASKNDSARWDTLMMAIREHEMKHIENACEASRVVYDTLQNEIAGSSHISAKVINNKIQEIVKHFRYVDLKYDRHTCNGRTEGVSLDVLS
jgi:predicted secreted Zn-dependent protease